MWYRSTQRAVRKMAVFHDAASHYSVMEKGAVVDISERVSEPEQPLLCKWRAPLNACRAGAAAQSYGIGSVGCLFAEFGEARRHFWFLAGGGTDTLAGCARSVPPEPCGLVVVVSSLDGAPLNCGGSYPCGRSLRQTTSGRRYDDGAMVP